MAEDAADEECESSVEWAERQPISVKVLGSDDAAIRDLAKANAMEQRDAYLERKDRRSDYVSDDGYEREPDNDRILVNYLRHRCTNYDELCNEISSWEYDYDGEYDESEEPFEMDNFDRQKAFFDEQNDAYDVIRQRIHADLSKSYPQYADIIEQNATNAAPPPRYRGGET